MGEPKAPVTALWQKLLGRQPVPGELIFDPYGGGMVGEALQRIYERVERLERSLEPSAQEEGADR